jgi:hypothetical protein
MSYGSAGTSDARSFSEVMLACELAEEFAMPLHGHVRFWSLAGIPIAPPNFRFFVGKEDIAWTSQNVGF